MKFSEIKILLDKGFTPDQIVTLSQETEASAPETPEPPTPEPETPKTEAPADDRFAALEKAVSELTKTIQANALYAEMTPGRSVETDMQILASVINPSGAK